MNISSRRAFGNARKALIGLLLVGASCVSSQASAALVLFTITGPAPASFTLDQSPTPTSVAPNYFTIDHVVGTFLGAPSSNINLFFDDGRNWSISGVNFNGVNSHFITVDFLQSNAPLFSGTTVTPTFNLGTYSFLGGVIARNSPLGAFDATLTIASVDGAVPEPSTWMMMLVGFGLLGGAMRYGRNTRAGIQTAKLT